MHTSGNQTSALDYQSPHPSHTIGNSPLVRLIALLTSIILLALIAYFLHRSRQTLGWLSDWALPISAALAYSALISFNIAGRTTPGSISWLRRIGGVGTPVFLIITAVDWAQDALIDPYARRRNVLVWIAAAVAAGIVAIFIAYLAHAHWNDTNESPAHPRPIAK